MQNVLLVLAAVLYLLFPYDLFPDFLLGWGWLDDLLILVILFKIIGKLKSGAGLFSKANQYQQQTYHNDEQKHRERQQKKNGSQSSSRDAKSPKDPYEVLGISREADMDEIKKAYRKLANQYHPDKLNHLGEEFRALAEERFKDIQQAYQTILSNSK